MPSIVFPPDPLEEWKVDEAFKEEHDAAEEAGFHIIIGLGSGRRTQGIFRGWMMSPDKYKKLFTELEQRGVRLLNNPMQFLQTHYFPPQYGVLAGDTPKSVWTPRTDIDYIMELLSVFGDRPIILKDYVKSEKHYWNEACFISNARDRVQVKKTVGRFLELRGESLEGGLVFREYVPLRKLGIHPKSGAPLFEEFRLWFYNGKLIHKQRYWTGVEYPKENAPHSHKFEEIAKRVDSNFFTMDVGRRASAAIGENEWMLIELGDGQVAGLQGMEPSLFYKGLASLTA